MPSTYTVLYVDVEDGKEIGRGKTVTGKMHQTEKVWVDAPDSLEDGLYSFCDEVEGYPQMQTQKVPFTEQDGTLTFYYKKNTYTVNYYLNGTTEKVNPSTTRNAKLGSTVEEFPATISGYTPVSNDKKSITITKGTNEINFYYYKNVTLTANSDTKTYDGTEHSVSGFTGKTVREGDPVTLSFDTVNVPEVKQKDAGTYPVEFNKNPVGKFDTTEKYIVAGATDGQLVIKKRPVTLTSASDSKVYDGKALTNDKVTAEGFVEGQGAAYEVTGSQTLVGSSKNTFEYKLNDGTKESNYDITKTEGTLEVTKNEKVVVKVKGKTDSVTYDGDPHSVAGYEVVSIEIDGEATELYKEDNITFDGETNATGTDANTYPMGLSANQFSNKNGNFTNVKFEVVEDGQLVINQRPVTLTSADATKVYDGTALTNGTVTADGFVKDEGATYKVTGSQTDVGTSNNTFEYTLNGNTKLTNYNITKVEGTLEVTKNEKVVVKVKGKTDSVTYDGDPHSVAGYEVVSIEIDGEATELYKEDNITFDGETNATGTDANTYPMGLSANQFSNKNGNFTNVKFEVVEDGQLVINQRPVTLTSADATKVYDGTALTNGTVTADGFVKDEGATYKVTGSQTDVGTSNNTFEYTLNGNTKLTNYNITKVEGKLTVTANKTEVVVTITGHNSTVTYNGSEQSVNGYDVSISPEGVSYTTADFSFDGNAEVKGTDADTYPMGLKADQFANTNGNFTNVRFDVADGWLKITPKTIKVTVTGNTDTKVYNGKTQSVNGFTTNKPEGVTVTLKSGKEAKAEGQDVETYYMGLTEEDFEVESQNYNVELSVNDGWLEITPVTDKVTVTVTEKSDTVTYDGDEHKVEGYKSITADNTLYDVATSVKATQTEAWTAKGTAAGEYPVGIVAGDFENTNKNFTNVEFKIVDGALTINPVTDKVTVTIKGRTLETTYDGKVHDVFGYDATPSNALYRPNEDIQFNGTDYDKIAKGTDAGKYDMKLTVEHFTNISDNFTNVEFIVTDGYVKINPRSVKLTSETASKTYDGKPLTNETVAVGGDGFADGEGATYDFTGSQTDVGESDNLFTFEVNEGTKKENYTFEVAIGTLKVNPVTDKVTVTVTEKSDTVTYDGGNHTVSGYASMTADNPLYDVENDVQETPNAAWAANGTDAGEYPLGIVAGDFKNINTNFENVEFVVVDGALKIDPAPVTLQAPIASKTYDGTPLKAEDYGHSFVEGLDFADDFASISVEGSQTQAGSSVSQIKEVVPKKGKDLKNYKLTFLPGTLTVAKRSVLLTSQSATKTYDGSALTRPAVTITGDGFVPGELAKVEATGSITNVGSTPNAIQYTTTGAFNPANYSIALSVGTLTVTAKPEPEPRRTFNLTVNYVYQNGKRAAASYNRGGLKNGETFDITSPVIAGYTASETVVSGTIDNRDIKVTVIYTADGVNLDDYGVPLGLGNITMNVGDCFE